MSLPVCRGARGRAYIELQGVETGTVDTDTGSGTTPPEATGYATQAALDAEETAREAADATLQGNLDAVEDAAIAADAALDARVDALETTAADHEDRLDALEEASPGSGLDLTGRSHGDVLYVDTSSGTPAAAWLSRPADHATTTYVLGLYDGVPAWVELTDATVEPPPTESGPWTGTLTIASGTVSSTLTDFVVAVDLATLPAGFWAAVTIGGGDIRVTESDGTTLVPIDVVQINKGAGTGLLFFKAPSIASGADTTFKILAGDPANTSLDATDPNGRNAVWSDYHRVFCGASAVDRTGQGTDLTAVGGTITGGFSVTAMSPDLSTMHQGVTWDGTFYYTTDTDELVKWDDNWVEVARNATPLADTGLAGVTHCGDLEAYGGELYIPVETYPSGPYVNQHIAVFSAADLSFLRSYDISAQGREASSIAYNPADGLLYVSDYTNGASLPRYQLDGTFVGALALSTTISQIQGITFFGGKLYVSGGGDRIYRVSLEGTVEGEVYDSNFSGEWEGIGHTDRGLLVLNDGSSFDRVLTLSEGWLRLNGGMHGVATGLTKFTQWTMGASVVATLTGGNMAALSYSENSADNALRATLSLRSTGSFGLWNSVDTWAMDAALATTSQEYRVVHVQDGTTSRKLYQNGTLVVTDTGTAQRPAGLGDTLFVGAEDTSAGERWQGSMNYAYLRNGVLPDAWLAAEDKSWRTPATFYTVTSDA